MARSIWKGSISFGLVSIPVGLITATESQALDLDLIDKRDHSRIHYKKVSAKTGREVPQKNIVKGYQFEKGDYVIIDDKDLKKANPKATQTIDIESFVDVAEVDVRYFERPYLLEVLKGGEKAYALLRETLKKTRKVGIAKVVIRTKQYLSAIMPQDDLLVLELMRFPHELREPDDLSLKVPKTKASAQEVRMAEQLVHGLTGKWNPAQYKDTYFNDVMKLIKKKIKQGDVEEVEMDETDSAPSASAKVLDLMPLLKKSLEGAKPHKIAKKARKKVVKRGA